MAESSGEQHSLQGGISLHKGTKGQGSLELQRMRSVEEAIHFGGIPGYGKRW
jgi:hypothetical protein